MATVRYGSSAVVKLGVLGSAFNPPHYGHLALAQEAIWALELERVILVPTGQAPHKVIENDPGSEVRLAMTRLAAAEGERLEVSAIEVQRPGLSYTYEPLEQISRDHPGAELHLLLGADAAAGLAGWRHPERVVELARMAVARRAGVADSEVRAVLARVGAEPRASMLDMPPFGVSSSLVRERAAARQPLRYLTPDPVAKLIVEQRIYGGVDGYQH